MDEHLSESHAGSVDALGDAPMVDLLAELMGNWAEMEAAPAEASEAVAVEAAAPVADARAVAACVEEEPAVVAAAPEPEPDADLFLAALLAEQGEETPAADLTNLAVTVDALTETTSPAPAATDSVEALASMAVEAADESDVLDSLISDLARSAESEAPADTVAEAAPEIPENAEKYVLFSLAGMRYAVAIHQVIETDRLPQITRVPHVPEFVRGIVNLRGDILSLIDLRTLWGLPALEAGKPARLLVVRSSGEQVITGLVVDDVNGIAPIAPESLAVREGERNEKIARLLRGVYEHQQQSLHVIDLERLFLSPEIQQLTAN